MSYRIEFTPAAARTFRKLDHQAQARLQGPIDELATDPRPASARTLKGSEGLLRLRVGSFRVIYRIEEARLLVVVVTLGHRREVYR